jgi:Z1 domain
MAVFYALRLPVVGESEKRLRQPVGWPMPEVQEGELTARTKQNLIRGVRAKPLSQATVDAIATQARELIQKAVDLYDAGVASGEVGFGGSAVASEAPPSSGRGPTGLLYGRVQSGKTAAMILASAVGLDNGFRVVVVVTANNVALVRQTADRFKALAGPRVFSTLKDATGYEWEGQESDLLEDLREDGLVIVCAKDSTHLPEVMGLLQQLEAAAVPALIFDDEADAATPDTTLAARSAGRPNAPLRESTMYRNIVENTAPGEQGESLREVLPHHVFVQVTATPFVLFLQRGSSPIRPLLTHLLEPGEGYTGGEVFFGAFDPGSTDPPAPPLVIVAATEAQALAAARRTPPVGLATSIGFFLLSGAAHSLLYGGGRFPEKGYKHLSHTSLNINEHTRVAEILAHHLRNLRRILRRPGGQDARNALQSSYQELTRTLGAETPTLDALLAIISENLQQAEVIRVNAQTDEPVYGPSYNFLVGGNILARGLTIDDLLVTYYLREARTPQMDTVWQHARMYGYRRHQLPHLRVYLPRHLATLFLQIHESEEALRGFIPSLTDPIARPVPIRLIRPGRPTRPNALEVGPVRLYTSSTAQIIPYYLVTAPELIGTTPRQIQTKLRELHVPLDESERANRFREVPVEALLDLVDLVPVRPDDDGRWATEAVMALLQSTSEEYGAKGYVYVRRFEPGEDDPRRRRVRGVLAGPEVQMAQAKNKFVLALVYTGTAESPMAWYPTLVVPRGMRPHIFNAE